MSEAEAQPLTASPPPGEYAIVEFFGHTIMVGRVTEVERFGTRMMAMEPIFRDELLPPVFNGGASIYRMTPCSAEVAFNRQARHVYELPSAVRPTVPALLLQSPDHVPLYVAEVGHDDDAVF